MEVTRLFDLLPYQLQNFSQPDAVVNKVNGEWVKYSSQDLIDNANQISIGLLKSGIGKDDKIAIISSNRPEWNFIDFGIQQLGAVSVPIYPTMTEEDYRFIFTDADVRIVFVENADLYQKVKHGSAGLASLKAVYSINPVEGIPHWTELKKLALGEKPAQLDSYKAAVQADDLVTLIYTSGTTGTPKGVMLTHHNIISNFKSCTPLMPVDSSHRALSFLPMCHIYERMMIYLYVFVGVSIYYAESLDTIGDNLKEVKPHIFTTVPRLLEKVYDKIVAKGRELTGIKRRLFFWALDLGNRYEISKPNGWWYDLQLSLANKLIFSKWREALGGNVMAVVSGSAALQPRLARIFWAAQIRVMEGYGLTETSPVISVNRVEAKENRIGTVGPLIPDVEVKIASDGEILTKGPNLMKGYYKRPDLTAEVIDKDGWFHTGDIGEFVEGKYLKITDRKKEMFKTSGGKYIAPQLIENKLKEFNMIEQVMVVGENQKFPSALIVPAFPVVKKWCEIKGITYTTDSEIIGHPQVLEKFQKEIDRLNENFAQWEKIKKFRLLPELWTINSGELTAKLSLKRKVILTKYKSKIDEMYSE